MYVSFISEKEDFTISSSSYRSQILFFLFLQGKISADDIKRMAKDLGENFTDAEIREMVEEADRDRKFLNFSLCKERMIHI